VVLLQDMLEVFTRDMVVNENRLVNLTALNLEYNNSHVSSINNNNVCFSYCVVHQ